MESLVPIVGIILRIIGSSVCSSKAGELNRSKSGWGIFGFALPVIAMISIQFMNPINILSKKTISE